MTAEIDLVALWIGRAVLLAGAIGIGACIAAGLNALAGAFFWTYARKIGFTARNWRTVAEWDGNGRPEWKQGDDGVFHMVPTTGKYEVRDARLPG